MALAKEEKSSIEQLSPTDDPKGASQTGKRQNARSEEIVEKKKQRKTRERKEWWEGGKHQAVEGTQEVHMGGGVFIPPPNLEVTIRNGIRFMQPYWGVYSGYAKSRWFGRTIAEVFNSEFAVYHSQYAKAACRMGRIFVNKRPILSADYRIHQNDFFLHINHRHETEVPNLPIQIVLETDDLLAVNKPAGIPVHPCGNYTVHSVIGLLRREYGRTDTLKLLYRLDRTTTGLLLLAKNDKFDAYFRKLLIDQKVCKEYLCKVEGQFPEGETICDARIGVLSHMMGIRCVKPDGQEAFSRFRRLHYWPEQNASLVSCTIVTGRTHQIRVHLQYLGYPIIGDHLYNDSTWGPTKGSGADFGQRTLEELAADIFAKHSKKNWILEQDTDYEERVCRIGNDEMYPPEEHDLKNLAAELLIKPNWDAICWDCSVSKKRPMEKCNWTVPLHCWRYSGDNWSYEAPLPEWANTTSSSTMEAMDAMTAAGL